MNQTQKKIDYFVLIPLDSIFTREPDRHGIFTKKT